MKYLKLALLALVAVFATTSCMDDDWKDPNSETSPYGNNSIQEDKNQLKTIAELKEIYGKSRRMLSTIQFVLLTAHRLRVSLLATTSRAISTAKYLYRTIATSLAL